MGLEDCFYVYAWFRPWDGSPCHIGKGKGRRWINFGGRRNLHLRNIINKAGGKLPSIIIRSDLSEENAFLIERAFIAAIGRFPNGPLADSADGGQGSAGYRHTDEAKMRLKNKSSETLALWRKKNVGQKRSAQTCERIKQSLLGKKRTEEQKSRMRLRKISEETKEKMRTAKLGTKQNSSTIEKRAAKLRGKKRDPAIGAKISAAKMGHATSDESRAKMRAANRSRDPEVRARIAAATRAAMARLSPEAKQRMRDGPRNTTRLKPNTQTDRQIL